MKCLDAAYLALRGLCSFTQGALTLSLVCFLRFGVQAFAVIVDSKSKDRELVELGRMNVTFRTAVRAQVQELCTTVQKCVAHKLGRE